MRKLRRYSTSTNLTARAFPLSSKASQTSETLGIQQFAKRQAVLWGKFSEHLGTLRPLACEASRAFPLPLRQPIGFGVQRFQNTFSHEYISCLMCFAPGSGYVWCRRELPAACRHVSAQRVKYSEVGVLQTVLPTTQSSNVINKDYCASAGWANVGFP